MPSNTLLRALRPCFLLALACATALLSCSDGAPDVAPLRVTFDPIPELTSRQHPVPAEGLPLPLGARVTLRAARAGSAGSTPSWSSSGGSVRGEAHVFVAERPGVHELSVRDAHGSESIKIEVLDLAGKAIALRHASPARPAQYVGGPVVARVETDPPQFARIAEWKSVGMQPATGFGPRYESAASTHSSNKGKLGGSQHSIQASIGTISTPTPIQPVIYTVRWAVKPSKRDYFQATPIVRLYHEIRTEPAGYEHLVPWTYDTTGTAEVDQTSARGKSFCIVRQNNRAHPLLCYRVQAGNLVDARDFVNDLLDTPLQNRSEQPPKNRDCGPPDPSSHSLPVNLANGELKFTTTDLRVPSRGFDFVWSRSYASRANFRGPAGHNWTLNYERRVYRIPGEQSVSVVDGLQREDLYQKGSGNNYVSAAGYYDSLVENPDTTFTQVDKDGTRYDYDTNGCLAAITDRTGKNTMTFLRNAQCNIEEIVDTQGRKYTLRYTDNTPSQLLSSITDFRGRTVRYTYDTNDDLIRVTSPIVVGTPTANDFPNGKTTLYTYSSGQADARLNHNLISIVEPGFNVGNDPGQSKAMVTMSYATTSDPASIDFDRVVAERWGHDQGGAASNPNVVVGGTTTLQYSDDLASDSRAPSLAFSRTIETTRNGNRRIHYFNRTLSEIRTIHETNRNIRPGEGDYATDFEYSPEGLLTKITHPRGNVTAMLYDEGNARREAQKNKLEVRRQVGAVGGGLTDLVTRYTYEPIYQLPRTITSPRGFPSGQVPLTSNGKLDLSNALVARHTLSFVYDYQETTGVQAAAGIAPGDRIPEGLGDRNGASDFNVGNVVAIDHPTIQTDGPNKGQRITEKKTWNERGQLVDLIDPLGRVKRHLYYPRQGSANNPDDREGYVEAIVDDANGFALTTRYAYDTSGNVTAITDPKGQTSTTIYNQLNQVVRTLSRPFKTGGARYQVDHFYSANNDRVRTETANLDADGAAYPHATIVDRVEHDILHQVVATIQDRTRDDGTEAGSVRTEFFYDAQTHQVAVRRPAPRLGTRAATITTTLYDERELPFRTVMGDTDSNPANAPPADAVVTYKNYDANGNLLETSDSIRQSVLGGPSPRFPSSAPGDVIQHAYDGFDRRTTTTDAEGAVVTLEYDMDSNVTRTKLVGLDSHSSGAQRRTLQESTAIYDEIDRVVSSSVRHFDETGAAIGDGLRVTTTSYDAESKVTSVQDDRGVATSTQYDTADRVRVLTDNLGNTVESEYDANSNPVRTTRTDRSSGAGSGVETFVTTVDYDGLDRVIKTVDPDGNTNELSYDSRGNVVRSSDAVRGTGSVGNLVRFRYDALDRVVRTERALTANGRGDGSASGIIATSAQYDDDSRVASQTDANATVTRYEYDRLARLTRLIYGDATERQSFYNNDNQVTSWRDQNGTTCAMTYDGLDRLRQRSITRASGVLGPTYERFGYDALGRTTLAENDDGFQAPQMRCEFSYDSLQNMVVDKQGPWTVRNAFDAVSNRVRCDYPGAFGSSAPRTLTSSFDGLNRLATIDEGSSTLARYDYKGPGRVERRRLGQGASGVLTCTTSFDAVPRPIVLEHKAGASTVARFEYGYDRAHHRLFEKRVHDANRGEIYSFDSVYRVVRQERDVDLTSVAAGTRIQPENYFSQDFERWSWDGAGNRTSSTDSVGGNATTTSYTRRPNSNQYASRQVGSAAATPYLYDANGNLTDDGSRVYAYDFKNRLVEVRSKAPSQVLVRYSYDALDRRAFKVVDPLGATPTRTNYVWDGTRCIEERDGSGALSKQYVWGVSGDELLQIKTGTSAQQTLWSAENSIGSVTALVDDTGTPVERYRYDAFGNTTLALDGSTGNEYRFQTTRLDPESGLYWFRARHYSPTLGRFLQKDPIGIWTDSVNLGNGYTFAGNDLVNGIDPSGLCGGKKDDEGCGWNPFCYAWEGAKAVGKGIVETPLRVVDMVGLGLDVAFGTNNYDVLSDLGQHQQNLLAQGHSVEEAVWGGLGHAAKSYAFDVAGAGLGALAAKALAPLGKAAMNGLGKMAGRSGDDVMAGATRQLDDAVQAGRRQTGTGNQSGSADAAYDRIRASTDDVQRISNNTGIKPENVQKVKDHVFHDEHVLDRYVDLGEPARISRFDSDADMAAAWDRLTSGSHTAADMQMLRHEAAEAWYMRRHGPGYNAAHNAAQDRYPSPFQ